MDLTSSLRRRRKEGGPYLVPFVGLLVLVVLVAAAWWLWPRDGEEAPAPEAEAPAATDTALAADTPADTPSAGPPTPDTLDLPPREESDPFVRDRLGDLSDHPRFAEWLRVDDLVGRFVTALANLAVGASPAEQLPFLRPEEPFQVRDTGAGLVVDDATYRRYDAMSAAVASVDTEVAARLYRGLHPLMAQVHRGLGLGDRTFDETVARSLGALLAVEIPEGPLRVIPADTGVVYLYADPALEALPPAEKHVLRLGPQNARRVQGKARELAAALGIEPVVPGEVAR